MPRATQRRKRGGRVSAQQNNSIVQIPSVENEDTLQILKEQIEILKEQIDYAQTPGLYDTVRGIFIYALSTFPDVVVTNLNLQLGTGESNIKILIEEVLSTLNNTIEEGHQKNTIEAVFLNAFPMQGGLIRTVSRPRPVNNSWKEIEVDTLVGQLAAEIDDVYPDDAWDIKEDVRSFLALHFANGAPITENNTYFEEQLEAATGLANIDPEVRDRVWAVYKKLNDFDGNLFADAFSAHLEKPGWMQNGGKKNRKSRKSKKTRKTRKTRKPRK
jgi:hypothetical protein